MATTVRVDIVSDVVCPWCLIGWERLKRASEELRGEIDLEIHWRPYELNPQIAAEGVERAAYVAAKFGPGRMEEMSRRISDIALADGIAMNMDRILRQPRTMDAHRLIGWAQAQGRGTEMSEALFRAHFVEGRDIGHHDTLVLLASELGFSRDSISAFLLSGEDAERIRKQQVEAQRLGIKGVPFYILAERLGVAGAQEPAVLVDALRQAAAQQQTAAAAAE